MEFLGVTSLHNCVWILTEGLFCFVVCIQLLLDYFQFPSDSELKHLIRHRYCADIFLTIPRIKYQHSWSPAHRTLCRWNTQGCKHTGWHANMKFMWSMRENRKSSWKFLTFSDEPDTNHAKRGSLKISVWLIPVGQGCVVTGTTANKIWCFVVSSLSADCVMNVSWSHVF